jgi:uncharacterized protein YjiS (DUF1127 family)
LIAVLANPMENVEMTVTTLFSDDVEFVSTPRAATNHVANAFAAAARAVTAWRAERARRLAFNDLLAMEPHRLRDLGITPYDVREALRQSRAVR